MITKLVESLASSLVEHPTLLGLRPKTIKIWIRSITHTRLGVDRRKGDRRRGMDQRQTVRFHALLTRDEISDLLSM
ncbi:hypothetical protein [Desulforhopalus sp. IMCC35007]|uniref:hypothetical protein n=1 Tax=Desulforhopalus sp. IMCC35007 TaxID=2569543 RepID=UPI0010AEE84C|nr:hypothetical protein [Desulforhopalus sp. IMCC35007]TKB06811.1 hypothetical protein FCL48_19605 [Desulforhopalus sp. IMCC35007]